MPVVTTSERHPYNYYLICFLNVEGNVPKEILWTQSDDEQEVCSSDEHQFSITQLGIQLCNDNRGNQHAAGDFVHLCLRYPLNAHRRAVGNSGGHYRI